MELFTTQVDIYKKIIEIEIEIVIVIEIEIVITKVGWGDLGLPIVG